MNDIARNQVFALERTMLTMPQVELKVVEYHANGVYGRELHIPAGTTLTGAIHKYKNLNTLSQGEMSVLIDGEMRRVQAPMTVVSDAGTKRVAYAHTDCIWTTYFATEITDSQEIIDHFTCNSEQDYLAHCECLKLEGK